MDLQPIDPKKRIDILDVLRGFALMGILFNNILYFSGYAYLPFEKLRQFPTFKLDEAIYHLLDVIITAKFYTLFSILFAIGFYLQYSKSKEDPARALGYYRRRLCILLLFGILHSLFWSGDILLMYAIIGFIVILFRNINKEKLLKLSMLIIFLPSLISLALSPFFSPAAAPQAALAHATYPDMTPDALMNIFQHGDIPEIFVLNLHNLLWKWLSYIPTGRLLITFGIFLFGYYLGVTNFLAEKARSYRLWILSLVIGLSTTLTAVIMGGNPYAIPPNFPDSIHNTLLTVGQLSLCMFYITSIVHLMEIPRARSVLNYLKPVGRMALTNYLSQSLICVILFYNFGFNLIGKLGWSYIVIIAVSILAFQVILSNLWLRYFRFGPLEWAWRSLTYRRRIALQ